ncbi:MAG: hypothetical protein GY724_07820 [Actinomycetia bacterium]|nr:hypothetical protein [Actinomycetes bacterium]MCP4224795.1 hypothetical protein [Actinomycetes bacterium]MCP5032785.1 hypothetical protein [Actinomycetes bacterium]
MTAELEPTETSDESTGPFGRMAGAVSTHRRLAYVGGLLLAIGAAVVIVWALIAGPLASEELPDRVAEAQLVTDEEFIAVAGAELVFIAETANGGMLDVRYRVIDPDKALVFHDETLPLGIYRDGVLLERPFHEHSHDVELHQAVVYNELIVNLNNALHRGDVVTVVVGPYRLENVLIQ